MRHTPNTASKKWKQSQIPPLHIDSYRYSLDTKYSIVANIVDYIYMEYGLRMWRKYIEVIRIAGVIISIIAYSS